MKLKILMCLMPLMICLSCSFQPTPEYRHIIDRTEHEKWRHSALMAWAESMGRAGAKGYEIGWADCNSVWQKKINKADCNNVQEKRK